MAQENFFLDNKDLKFLVEQIIDWKGIVDLKENIGSADCPYGSAEEAIAAYRDMLQDPVGELAAKRIAPRAEEVDSEGCTLENGKVLYPVKGATIVGNGPDALTRVGMIGNDMALDTGVGTCGKEGQSVPVSQGLPTIRVSSITVGGRGKA